MSDERTDNEFWGNADDPYEHWHIDEEPAGVQLDTSKPWVVIQAIKQYIQFVEQDNPPAHCRTVARRVIVEILPNNLMDLGYYYGVLALGLVLDDKAARLNEARQCMHAGVSACLAGLQALKSGLEELRDDMIQQQEEQP